MLLLRRPRHGRTAVKGRHEGSLRSLAALFDLPPPSALRSFSLCAGPAASLLAVCKIWLRASPKMGRERRHSWENRRRGRRW